MSKDVDGVVDRPRVGRRLEMPSSSQMWLFNSKNMIGTPSYGDFVNKTVSSNGSKRNKAEACHVSPNMQEFPEIDREKHSLLESVLSRTYLRCARILTESHCLLVFRSCLHMATKEPKRS